MGAEMPTLPGQQKRRPWWAAALLGGASAGVVIAGALGLGPAARGGEPKVAAAAIVAPQESVTITLEEWRQLRIDIRDLRTELNATNSEMSKLNGRLSRLEGAQEGAKK